jgi:hypothetical protein
MVLSADKILFRASGLGQIMTEPRGKSNLVKHNEALFELTKQKNKYSLIPNKRTKLARLQKAKVVQQTKLVAELEAVKDLPQLSETCKKHLIKLYAQVVLGRRTEIKNKFLAKGHAREEDGITLLSRVTKNLFKKNTERLYNEYTTGEPDLFTGASIRAAKKTVDIKCSWSLETFLETIIEDLNDNYFYQGQDYMWLTGAEEHIVAYCLVNGTVEAINDEIFSLKREYGVIDDAVLPENHIYHERARQVERNHIFDIDAFIKEYPHYTPLNDAFLHSELGKYVWEYDIPMEKRVFRFSFLRDEVAIDNVKKKVVVCRAWMNANLFENIKYSRVL